MRFFQWVMLLSVALSVAACGGGGGGSSTTAASSSSSSSDSSGASDGGTAATAAAADNTAVVTVSAAVSGRRPNVPYTTVQICVPNTTTCQTIDNVLVDTGSVGLRLLASALTTLTLPLNTSPGGQTLGECVEFVDGYSWGAVRSADVTVGGLSANGAAVQVINDSAVPTVPTDCAYNGATARDTPASLGANGVLGIGQQKQDCGSSCAVQALPRTYYGCNGGDCTSTTLPIVQQVQNPVSLFPSDNNGTVIAMPSVDAAGTETATGQLIFGIGTRSNNALGTASIVTTDTSGQLSVVSNGQSSPTSYIDSGSNAIFFNDTGVPVCTSNTSFYCPTSTMTVASTLTSNVDATTASASVVVANAETLLSANSSQNNALPGLAGPGYSDGVDLGFPFYYGKRVFTAIEGSTTPAGDGPFIAF